jgi:hypothetical protein
LEKKYVCNLQEARALLGRYEYQKGNLVSALHVFEGIDIGVVTPKIKIALSRNKERRKKHSHNHGEPEMSIHSVGLLLESLFLKAKSLQALERFKGTLVVSLILRFSLCFLLQGICGFSLRIYFSTCTMVHTTYFTGSLPYFPAVISVCLD